MSIAIVGGGFAGLTVAAGLLKKQIRAKITIFEQRDTLLPLQQGSDSRWLHPHIYDWPLEGSESFSAALPVLNWTAARASDVVVQVLRDWAALLRDLGHHYDYKPELKIFCNTRHLQIAAVDGKAVIEWVGEPRDPDNPATPEKPRNPEGGERAPGLASGSGGWIDQFHLAILTVGFGLEKAVGFGLEKDSQVCYWRNETLAQPHLGNAAVTYIVSGAGDGAMIDLFRLRIAQFRQDRILSELFNDHDQLRGHLQRLADKSPAGGPADLFQEFSDVWDEREPRYPHLADQAAKVRGALRDRLRHDTKVVLHVRQPRFADLFNGRRVSFQNRLLAFLLFRVGGFEPSSEPLSKLQEIHAVPPARVIKRHGTCQEGAVKHILSADLRESVNAALKSGLLHQPDVPAWDAGYFGIPGDDQSPGDSEKGRWRKEYLPSPTQSIAASFCCAVAGYLAHDDSRGLRRRVTFHRMLQIGHDVVLQQCCEYYGIPDPGKTAEAAGRTFESHHGTIGIAYARGKVYRTREGATNKDINEDMGDLDLNASSRKMADWVQSIAAIPVIGEAREGPGAKRDPVIGVLYLDSAEEDYFVPEERITALIAMTRKFAACLSSFGRTEARRVVNNAFWRSAPHAMDPPTPTPDPATFKALQELSQTTPPIAIGVSQINFDLSDFQPVER